MNDMIQSIIQMAAGGGNPLNLKKFSPALVSIFEFLFWKIK